jgi:hypothetical protein
MEFDELFEPKDHLYNKKKQSEEYLPNMLADTKLNNG